MEGSKQALKILVGITGASGAIYARMVVEELLASDCATAVGLIFSRNGRAVAGHEKVAFDDLLADDRVQLFENDDMFASPASGSAWWDAMVVVPCSMGTAARIAGVVSDSLLCRAADVMLKERRRLIIVPREMPFSALHLRNLLTLSELGAVVIPASPAFYAHPSDLDDLCRTVVERITTHLGLPGERFEWK